MRLTINSWQWHAIVFKHRSRSHGFCYRHRFRKRDPRQPRNRRIAQKRCQIPSFTIDLRNQRIRAIWRVRSGQRIDDLAMSGLHAIQHLCQASKRLGHLQHAKRVASRCGVDDDQAESPVAGEAGNFQECGELVDPGQRQSQHSRYVFLVEPRAAKSNLFEDGPSSGEPSLERLPGIDLGRIEHAGANRDASRVRRQWMVQRVAERWCGIGGDDERRSAALRGRYGD